MTTTLSINRNIGLKYSNGSIICFPDDDCTFYKDTLVEVEKKLKNDNYTFCIGRIFDRKNNINILKNWSSFEFKINRVNSYFISSSITLFIKNNSHLKFDENMGFGSQYGAGEDSDLIYRLLKIYFGVYSPQIELWHPEANTQTMSLDKVKNYAAGFGYFIRKDVDATKILLLLLLLSKKSFQFILNIFNRKHQKNYFYFCGILTGLLKREDKDV